MALGAQFFSMKARSKMKFGRYLSTYTSRETERGGLNVRKQGKRQLKHSGAGEPEARINHSRGDNEMRKGYIFCS